MKLHGFFKFFQRKCDIYWPRDEGTEIYGQIAAQLEKEETMADFTIRTIKIKHVKVSSGGCTSHDYTVQYKDFLYSPFKHMPTLQPGFGR